VNHKPIGAIERGTKRTAELLQKDLQMPLNNP